MYDLSETVAISFTQNCSKQRTADWRRSHLHANNE